METAQCIYRGLRATINWDDGWLRVDAGTRLDKADFKAIMAQRFKYTRGDTEFRAPYTPERHQWILDYFELEELEEDFTDLVEKAEERADRYDGYASNAQKSSDAAYRSVRQILDIIPPGQPVLVGHHSERRHRRDLDKVERGLRKGYEEADRASYWRGRANTAIRMAKVRYSAPKIHRRIEELRADLRKVQRNLEKWPDSINMRRWAWYYENRIAFAEALLEQLPEEKLPLSREDLDKDGWVLSGYWHPIIRVNQKTVTYQAGVLEIKMPITDILPHKYLSKAEVERAVRWGLAVPMTNGGFRLSCTYDEFQRMPIPRNLAFVPVETGDIIPVGACRTVAEATHRQLLSPAQREKINYILSQWKLSPVALYSEPVGRAVVLEVRWNLREGYNLNNWVAIGRDGFAQFHRERLPWCDSTPFMDLTGLTTLDEETRTMHTLYTFGYAGADPAALAESAERENWLVLDTRMSPYSRSKDWNTGRLKSILGDRYQHVSALGNKNYKNGGPIELADAERGLDLIQRALLRQPVVLLCGCKDVSSCHRSQIAGLAAEAFGCEVVHLAIKDLVPPVELSAAPEQGPAPDEPSAQRSGEGHLLIQRGMPGFGDDKLAAPPTQQKLL